MNAIAKKSGKIWIRVLTVMIRLMYAKHPWHLSNRGIIKINRCTAKTMMTVPYFWRNVSEGHGNTVTDFE